MSRWTFTDGVTAEVFTFEMNPQREKDTPVRRPVAVERSTAGARIITQGRRLPATKTVEGVVRTKAGLDLLNEVASRRRQFLVTGELARAKWMLITKFSYRPQPRLAARWRHTYTMELTELNIP